MSLALCFDAQDYKEVKQVYWDQNRKKSHMGDCHVQNAT